MLPTLVLFFPFSHSFNPSLPCLQEDFWSLVPSGNVPSKELKSSFYLCCMKAKKEEYVASPNNGGSPQDLSDVLPICVSAAALRKLTKEGTTSSIFRTKALFSKIATQSEVAHLWVTPPFYWQSIVTCCMVIRIISWKWSLLKLRGTLPVGPLSLLLYRIYQE